MWEGETLARHPWRVKRKMARISREVLRVLTARREPIPAKSKIKERFLKCEKEKKYTNYPHTHITTGGMTTSMKIAGQGIHIPARLSRMTRQGMLTVLSPMSSSTTTSSFCMK